MAPMLLRTSSLTASKSRDGGVAGIGEEEEEDSE